jgi:hypothetical protein
MQDVVQSLEKTVSQVHVSNWIDILEMNASWKLSVRVCPFVFNSLHMPLVHYNNNFISLTFVYLFEKVLVSLINENAF